MLQVHIAQEESKFGLDIQEIEDFLNSGMLDEMQYICINGLMGMATNTPDES